MRHYKTFTLEMHRSTGQGPELADFSHDRLRPVLVSLPIPSRSVLTSHLRWLIIYVVPDEIRTAWVSVWERLVQKSKQMSTTAHTESYIRVPAGS